MNPYFDHPAWTRPAGEATGTPHLHPATLRAWEELIPRCRTRKDLTYRRWEITACKLMRDVETPVLAMLNARAEALGYAYSEQYDCYKPISKPSPVFA